MKKIIYEFDDGTKSEVEVDDYWYDFVTVSRRHEESYERKERRHTAIHLDWCEYEGEWFADKNTPASSYEEEIKNKELKEQEERFDEFICSLTPIQRKRLQYRLDDPKISLREISRLEQVDKKCVEKTFSQIVKKFETFYGKRAPK